MKPVLLAAAAILLVSTTPSLASKSNHETRTCEQSRCEGPPKEDGEHHRRHHHRHHHHHHHHHHHSGCGHHGDGDHGGGGHNGNGNGHNKPTPAPAKQKAKRSGGEPTICFYTQANFGGQSFCRTGSSVSHRLGTPWRNTIKSIKIDNNAQVRICVGALFQGGCTTIDSSVARLPKGIFNKVRSFKIKAPH